jgi:hypothetical protein
MARPGSTRASSRRIEPAGIGCGKLCGRPQAPQAAADGRGMGLA